MKSFQSPVKRRLLLQKAMKVLLPWYLILYLWNSVSISLFWGLFALILRGEHSPDVLLACFCDLEDDEALWVMVGVW